ncbi:MAG: PH domain-containing protein [Corynebacterium sp.]|nr:PH domain-containing protein [Corynebacterium sp.]
MNQEKEEALESYVAADPITTTTKPWEFEAHSNVLKWWALAAVLLVMAVHIFMAWAVGYRDTGAHISGIDRFAFVGIGVIISCFCLLLLRPRVRANVDGVEVRNFIGTRFYPWTFIYGLSFPKSARWARLELPDFEFVPMWAFQSADGEHVIRLVKAFRELEDKYMPED